MAQAVESSLLENDSRSAEVTTTVDNNNNNNNNNTTSTATGANGSYEEQRRTEDATTKTVQNTDNDDTIITKFKEGETTANDAAVLTAGVNDVVVTTDISEIRVSPSCKEEETTTTNDDAAMLTAAVKSLVAKTEDENQVAAAAVASNQVSTIITTPCPQPVAATTNTMQSALGNLGNPFFAHAVPVVISPGAEMHWDQLISGSSLVFLTDRNLVPDSLFVSMAQMEPCQLGELDRCGAYKSREIGFTGLKCKYCHGQPGFGRYFPASVRSLAQTTTSQTIVKHIAQRCQYCPAYVRAVVVELERQLEEATKGSDKVKKPHGGRKLFFERIWSRLHGVSLPESVASEKARMVATSDETLAAPVVVVAAAAVGGDDDIEQEAPLPINTPQPVDTSQTDSNVPSDDTDKFNTASSVDVEDDASNENKKDLSYPLKKRKHLFRSLPTQKRKRRGEGSSVS